MSVLKKRKKAYIKAVLIGVLSALVIVLLTAGVMTLTPFKNGFIKKGTNSDIKLNKIIVYKLTKSLNSNEIIGNDDIELFEIMGTTDMKFMEIESPIGKRVMLSLEKGTIICDAIVCKESNVMNDVRLHNYSYIKINDKLQKGCYIDIRISLPNGADYIIMSRKQVKDYSIYNLEEGVENSLWLEVSEEEILRMSSAAIDAYLNEGSFIYAVRYINEAQSKAIATYPVNKAVKQIIKENPNIINKAEDILEASSRNLVEYNNYRGNEDSHIDNEIYEEEQTGLKDHILEEDNTEIEYLD